MHRAALGRHKRQLLVYAEGSTRHCADRVARREITEQFAPVVVHAEAGPHYQLRVEHLRLPRCPQPGRNAPLPSRQRRLAHASSSIRIVSRDDEAWLCDRVRGRIVLVGVWIARIRRAREVEVEDTSILLRQAAVPVIPYTGRQAQVRCDLELILSE